MGLLVALLLSSSVLGSGEPVRVDVLSLLDPQRVDIVSPHSSLPLPGGGVLTPGAPLRVERAGGRVLASTRAGWRWSGPALEIGGPGVRLLADIEGRDRRRRALVGSLDVTSRAGSLRLVLSCEAEDLVASAVAAELEHVAEPSALEAAAIVLRSYVAANRGRHAANNFDLCDTTHCLVSRGAPDSETPAGRAAWAASRETSGLVLRFDGQTVAGFCTACCGGATTTPGELWGGAGGRGYTRVACSACVGSDLFRWRREASSSDVHACLEALLGRRVGPGADVAAEPGPGGETRSLVVRDGGLERRVNAGAFHIALGRRLGWDRLPSPRFLVARTGRGYEFRGRGHGHGIGLCLAGAVARARAGAGRDRILGHYFPLCTVGPAPSGRIRGGWRVEKHGRRPHPSMVGDARITGTGAPSGRD